MAKKSKYYVCTWDGDSEKFTPQKGVRVGPYSLFGLRRALRKLQSMGYDTSREGVSVFVQRDYRPDAEVQAELLKKYGA